MSSRRGSNGFAINPISYLDIEAYCRLAGVRFDGFELRLIEDLDNLYRNSFNGRSNSHAAGD